MNIAMKVKPIKIQPFFSTPISSVPEERVTPEPKITEKGDAPSCSVEQIRTFQQNWNKHVPPRVIRQARKTGNVLHGAYSTNMQLPSQFHRPTKDIDVWSKKGEKHAKQIEDQLDKCIGCDIAQVKESKVGKKQEWAALTPPGQRQEEDEEKYRRYTVVTAPKNDVDVDYSYPPDERPIKKKKIRGVYHETLEGAYERAMDLRYRPMRAGRASRDIKRIEDYWRSKGKVIK